MLDNFLFFKDLKNSLLKEDLKDFIFCTIHRSENTNNKNNFNKILKLLIIYKRENHIFCIS